MIWQPKMHSNGVSDPYWSVARKSATGRWIYLQTKLFNPARFKTEASAQAKADRENAATGDSGNGL